MKLYPCASALLLLLLPALLSASGPEATTEDLCPAGGTCAESEVELAEELEAAALRTELLQHRSERWAGNAPAAATAEVAVAADGDEDLIDPPAEEDDDQTEYPDDDDLSAEGPYDEVPDEAEAAHPRLALEGWAKANESDPGASLSDVGQAPSFCQTHRTGFFCQGSTRTRCCRQGPNYNQCGATVHATACGWHGPSHYHGPGSPGYPRPGYPNPGYHPGYHPGYPGYHPGNPSGWNAHPGWHQWVPPGGYNQFCSSHHTGSFCSHHTKISCCKKRGYFVSCDTSTRSHPYC